MNFYSDLIDCADMIEESGAPITIDFVTGITKDPVAGTVSETVSTQNSYGCEIPIDSLRLYPDRFKGDFTRETMRRFMFSAKGLTEEPALGTIINWRSKKWEIMQLDPIGPNGSDMVAYSCIIQDGGAS